MRQYRWSFIASLFVLFAIAVAAWLNERHSDQVQTDELLRRFELIPGGRNTGAGPFRIHDAELGSKGMRLVSPHLAAAKPKELKLTKCEISDDALRYLSAVTSLTMLQLDRNPINGAGLKFLKPLHQLTSLGLDSTVLTDDGLATIRVLKNLEMLRLRGTRITDDGLVHIQGLSNLVHLDLSDTNISGEGLSHLRDMQRLRSLVIGHLSTTAAGGLTPKGAPHLQELRQIENLVIGSGDCSAEYSTAASQLTDLKSLWLSGRVTNDCLAPLENLPNLVELTISSLEIDDEALDHVIKMRNVRKLILNPGLEQSRLTDHGLLGLKQMDWLETLQLWGQVTDDAVAELQDALPSLYVEFIGRPTQPARK